MQIEMREFLLESGLGLKFNSQPKPTDKEWLDSGKDFGRQAGSGRLDRHQ